MAQSTHEPRESDRPRRPSGEIQIGTTSPSGEIQIGTTAHLRDVAARSLRGLQREFNEDHYVVAELQRGVDVALANVRELEAIRRVEGTLLMAAHGIGRRGSGSFASGVMLRSLLDYTAERLPWCPGPGEEHSKMLLSGYARALISSKRRCRELCEDRHAEHLGTACGLVFVNELEIFAARTGETGCYMLRAGAFEELHAPADLTLRDSEEHGAVEAYHRSIHEGDRLVLCTRGLWRWVSAARVEEILRGSADGNEACNALLVEARREGSRDDATALVAFL